MENKKNKQTWTLVWSAGFSLLFLISKSWAWAFRSSPTTFLSVTDPREEAESCCLPGCPVTLAACWLGATCFSLSFSTSSTSAPFSEGRPFFASRPFTIDAGGAEWTLRTSGGAGSGTASADVDFFLPGAFLEARDETGSAGSLPSTANRPGGAPGEPSGVGALPRFSKSFLPSLLFSFSFSLLFSSSHSFSFEEASWGTELFSLLPLPAPRAASWVGNSGKRGDEEADVVDRGGVFPGAALRLSGVPCDARPRDTLEKVLKGGVKALVARGLEETPGRELELLLLLLALLLGSEPMSAAASELAFPAETWPPLWLLRRVIEWEGEHGWPRCVPRTTFLARRDPRLGLDDVWCGEREPGLLPDDDGSVTDS